MLIEINRDNGFPSLHTSRCVVYVYVNAFKAWHIRMNRIFAYANRPIEIVFTINEPKAKV